MPCSCSTIGYIKLSGDAITKRINESPNLKKTLKVLANSPTHRKDTLYQCTSCRQLWQASYSWAWGGAEYVFKVPEITVADWTIQHFMRPDEMMIYASSVRDYLSKNTFVDSEKTCKQENCTNKALVDNVLCKKHFLQSLQQVNLLPKTPEGRVFPPYEFA